MQACPRYGRTKMALILGSVARSSRSLGVRHTFRAGSRIAEVFGAMGKGLILRPRRPRLLARVPPVRLELRGEWRHRASNRVLPMIWLIRGPRLAPHADRAGVDVHRGTPFPNIKRDNRIGKNDEFEAHEMNRHEVSDAREEQGNAWSPFLPCPMIGTS